MRAKVLGLVGLSVLFIAAGTARAKPPETYPLSKVKRGQKGYGMTTFQGDTPERFEFEVIGVMRNFLPKLDIILVKSDDKKLEVSGFWRGMSGSPLYIDGKLACAFSYGFRFNKVPIGGCTPIEYMKREGFQRPRRVSDETSRIGRPANARSRRGARTGKKAAKSARYVTRQSAATYAEWLEVAPGGTVDSAFARLGPARRPWLLNAPRPPGPAIPKSRTEDGLTPASIPLALAGFSAPAFDQVKELMSDYPLEPMQSGGTGDANGGPTRFQMGGSIGVQLIRGDMSAAGTGTVSYLGGDGVLAFGHPMFQAGEFYAPVTSAEVHTVIPSAMSAFVVASPMRELGTLIQDRKSTIMADTSRRTRMVPVDIRVRVGDRPNDQGRFRVEVLGDRFFTGTLTTVAALNAANHYLPDRDRVTARIESKVHVRDLGSLSFVDYLHSSGGALGVVGGARGLRALVPLLNNPFRPIEIERVELDIRADYDTNYGDIRGIRLPTKELKPGSRSYVLVDMRSFNGERWVEKIPFDVPEQLAGSIVKLEVTSGDVAQIDAAPPQSAEDLMRALRKLLPGDVFAVTLYTAEEGVAIDGKIVRDLPASAADKLKTSTEKGESSTYRPLFRSLYKSKRVINGSETLLVKVADE